SNGTWVIASRSISKRWTVSVRPSITAGRFHRWPRHSANWPPTPTMRSPTCCRFELLAAATGPSAMFYVPLYVELLRSRPQLLFWFGALLQAAIWLAVPAVFYFSPPGDLAQLLAIGHEFRFDSGVGPPLAYWLGEIA